MNIVDNYDPDLNIMDIDLQYGANSLELTKKIKFEHPGIIVVILSQNDIPKYRFVAQQNGADFFFLKVHHLNAYLIMLIQ